MAKQRNPEQLKLLAFDADDLAVMSAHLQDAVVRVGDIAYLPGESRFALIVRRFDWESADAEPRRRLTGLHFERVLRCRTRGIDRAKGDDVLNLLAITFDSPDAPSGFATLHFAGDASIQIEVECVEAGLQDLGPVWACQNRPAHDLENA